MSFIYFAKVNINSEIYNIYNNPELADEILKNLFKSIGQDKRLKVEEKDRVWAKFINIEKDYDKQYITGRIVKIFEDDIETYDSEKDDVEPLLNKDLAKSVLFFFDLRAELVAFTTAKQFGKKKVVEYFSKLINSYSTDVKFEVFLKQNLDEINEKIKIFKRVSKVEITLIPPNNNEDYFHDLFLKNSDEIKEIGATKIEQTFSVSAKEGGVNIYSNFFKRVFDGISKGYGFVKITGKNIEDEPYTITSEEDAPQKDFIPERQKNSISAIKERGRAGIVKIQKLEQERKAKIKERE